MERIVFRNVENGYTVARLRINDTTRLFREDLVTIVGTLPLLAVGEIVECTGTWQVDVEHGHQLRVERFVPHTPVSPKGLARYLGSGIIKGIGPKTAERIVAHFGEQTLAVIELEPRRLTEIKGISPAKRDAIVAGWGDQREVRKIMLFLQSHNISPVLAMKIYKQYGQDAIQAIQENPYRLEQDILGVGFRTADAIALELGLPRDSQPRIQTGVKHALTEATSEGHCYLLRDEAVTRTADLLGVSVDLVIPALEALTQTRPVLGQVRNSREVIIEEDRAYLAPFFFSEVGVARRIRLLQQTSSALPSIADATWDRLLAAAETAGGGILPLAPRQREAVQMAWRNKVSILTGGPGTGKTTTIRTLVHILEDQNVSYALAAPTGRAARRMTEATGRAASTLHRLLEFIPSANDFARDEQRPLPIDFVIVDEVSMIDLVLMYNLLKAIAPQAHLLLVGDGDQLPSVGPGNVLRDLLASGAVPALQLTELFRQAATSRIIVTAHGVRDGVIPDIKPDAASDFFFMPAATPEHAADLILDLVQRRLPKRYSFDPVRDIQVLAPMYKGQAGVTALNEALQLGLNPPVADKPALIAGGRTFRAGDKVMQLRNDYDKGVFNGDVGFVTMVDSHAEVLVIEFGEGSTRQETSYEAHEIDALALAYAVSIHRAQGSEYAAVVIPLVMQHALLLQRNLLYTALTRAKRLAVLVGDPRALARAVQNDEVATRNTTLAERLRTVPAGLDAVAWRE